MTTRRSLSSEFKLEAIRLAEASGNTAQTARDLGIRADQICRWKKRFEEDGRRAFPGHGNPRNEELAKLRREVQRLKTEMHLREDPFESHDEARRALFEYIEIFYNRQRCHSTLGYLTPAEYEERYFHRQTTAA